MKLIQQPGKEKLLISKQKTPSFNTENTFCMKISSKEIPQIFYF